MTIKGLIIEQSSILSDHTIYTSSLKLDCWLGHNRVRLDKKISDRLIDIYSMSSFQQIKWLVFYYMSSC